MTYSRSKATDRRWSPGHNGAGHRRPGSPRNVAASRTSRRAAQPHGSPRRSQTKALKDSRKGPAVSPPHASGPVPHLADGAGRRASRGARQRPQPRVSTSRNASATSARCGPVVGGAWPGSRSAVVVGRRSSHCGCALVGMSRRTVPSCATCSGLCAHIAYRRVQPPQ